MSDEDIPDIPDISDLSEEERKRREKARRRALKHRNLPNKLLRYFAIAVVGALVYLILELPAVNRWFLLKIRDPVAILTIKVLILFTVLYVTNQILYRQCFTRI